MASARDRGPKLTTTVISTTEAAGCDVTMRRILGRWSEATTWVRSPIWARTRSVVQPTVCLNGRAPANISTITWANRLGNAVAWPEEASRVRSWPGAVSGAAGPGGPAGAGSWRLTYGLVMAASRATGHAAPWVSQSYGGQPPGTVISRSPEGAGGSCGVRSPEGAGGSGEVRSPEGAGGSDGVRWPGAVGGSGVRVLDGMFRLPGPENANGRERPRRPRSY